MTSRSSAEVAIVGAGPSGAWAAYNLARAGARVLVFDHSHPREKPCGGGVTRRAMGVVAGALTHAPIDGVPIERTEFCDPRTRPADVWLTPARPAESAPLVVTDRRAFDEALLRAAIGAGARHVAERVVDVEMTGTGAIVHTRAGHWPVGHVMGADGANSLVRRRVSRPFRREQLSIAVGVFAHGVTSTTIHVRFVASPSGYIWSFPRRDHLAIGICARADESTSTSLREILAGWMRETGLTKGATLEPYGWPIPSLGAADFAAQRAAGPGWSLTGDAAGLVDPITREGIYFALESGGFAAEALCDGRDPVRGYEDRLRQAIYPELSRAARLQQGFFRGGFTKLLVDALRHSAPVRAVMADLVSGEQSYRTLKRRLVGTFEFGLAWQLLRLETGWPVRQLRRNGSGGYGTT